MTQSQDPNAGAQPEEIFAEFLASYADDPQLDIEPYCKEHPEVADELRRLHADWQRVEQVLERLGHNQSLTQRLKSLFGNVDPAVSLDGEASSSQTRNQPPQRMQKLARNTPANRRYSDRGEIGRGGMGAVHRVWDQDLRRSLAMKMVLGKEILGEGEVDKVPGHKLVRFLEEAQITGQLDHPGIVPVHDLGLDAHGRLYFTMRLVKGVSFRQIISYVHTPELGVEDGLREEWNLTRALHVLLAVGEAVAYAHSKKVIHRDLKPANIMVGRFGETYVMDWGLAKIQGRPDLKNIRIREQESGSQSEVLTDRLEESYSQSEAPLITMDGDVVGTPTYMSPEQARGRVDEVDERSDVYSVGAMLYHLLCGQRPFFAADGRHQSPYAILEAVREKTPVPLEQVKAGITPELVAICQKAMTRKRDERYLDMRAFLQDLRNYLDQRVVGAYETGAVAEFRKWVVRNRALALSIGAGLVVLFAGLAGIGWSQSKGREVAEHERGLADKARLEAEEAEQKTQAVLVELEGYTEAHELQGLLTQGANALWPAYPEKTDLLREWLAQAAELVTIRPEYNQQLEQVRTRALPLSEADQERVDAKNEQLQARYDQLLLDRTPFEQLIQSSPNPLPEWTQQKAALDLQLEEVSQQMAVRKIYNYDSPRDALREDLLSELQAKLTELDQVVADVQKRLDIATDLRERSLDGPEAQRLWNQVLADLKADPRFAQHAIDPMLGLLPLRKHPQTGLWDFTVLTTGEAPFWDPIQERVLLDEDSGVVLTLLPPGSFDMGCDLPTEAHPLNSPNIDPDCQTGTLERPIHPVELDAFFVSKFEVTQAQWTRIMGNNPSLYHPTSDMGGNPSSYTLLRPVERVSWFDSAEFARRAGLTLPTEAQWEYACRSGSNTVFHSGNEARTLAGFANVADLALADLLETFSGKLGNVEALNDGHDYPAPVGSLNPNAFGLYDMHGNVLEWCLDQEYGNNNSHRVGDGLRLSDASKEPRMVKGGSWANKAYHARSAFHAGMLPQETYDTLGLRVAMNLNALQ